MTSADQFLSSRFPRASRYNPDWITASVSGGANALWIAEWLAEALDLKPGDRVLDLGCGRAATSIFLSREFGVQVWAADLMFSPSENFQRIRDAGVEDKVFPLHADARSLPFADGFFDAIVSIDSFMYYGTDDLYLSYINRFVKPGGQIGVAGAGLMQEIYLPLPEHLQAWWTQDLWCLHSPDWWRHHWARTGIVDVEVTDTLQDGWRFWRDWHHVVAPENVIEIDAVEADEGRYLGYVRSVCRRRPDAQISEVLASIPAQYTQMQLLRSDD